MDLVLLGSAALQLLFLVIIQMQLHQITRALEEKK